MEPKATDSNLVFFIKRLIGRYLDDDVSALSAECTYYFILGLIPFMIFLVHAVLFFAAPQLPTIVRLLQYLPHEVAVVIENNIYRIVGARSSLWMAGGLVAALWTSSQGMDTLVRSTDKAYCGDRNRQPYWRVKAKSLIFTLLLSFSMILSLGLIVFGNAVVYAIAYYFHIPDIFLDIWTMVKFGIPFTILAFVLAGFYQFAPDKRRSDWRRILTAAFIVTSCELALSAAYGYYILHISSMGITYGSLIGLIVLFIWFHLTAMVIIMGGEFIMAWKETAERRKVE